LQSSRLYLKIQMRFYKNR